MYVRRGRGSEPHNGWETKHRVDVLRQKLLCCWICKNMIQITLVGRDQLLTTINSTML